MLTRLIDSSYASDSHANPTATLPKCILSVKSSTGVLELQQELAAVGSELARVDACTKTGMIILPAITVR